MPTPGLQCHGLRRQIMGVGLTAVCLSCAAPRPASEAPANIADMLESAPHSSQEAPPPTPRPLSCARLVPRDFSDRWFHRAEIVEKQRGSGRATCTFMGGVLSRPVSLDFICSEEVVRPRFVEQVRGRFGNMAYQEVPALGRLAFVREDMQVIAWDDDAPCLVVLTGFQSRLDLLELTREFLHQLSLESLGSD
ncbi:MAG: hypothetical protein GYA21_16885 [Myxococcales bacterium]|nr:hypothetical protein [Myxococcales bacterium]